MLIGRMVNFNVDQYLETGRSWGMAFCPDMGLEVFVGTDNRRSPIIVRNSDSISDWTLEMRVDFPRNTNRLSSKNFDEGTEIVFFPRQNKKGLFALTWCLRTEWDAKVAELNELKRVEKEASEKRARQNKVAAEQRAAELKRMSERNPPSLEIALQNGWTMHQKNDKQVIVIRRDPKTGKTLGTKTFHTKEKRVVTRTRPPLMPTVS